MSALWPTSIYQASLAREETPQQLHGSHWSGAVDNSVFQKHGLPPPTTAAYNHHVHLFLPDTYMQVHAHTYAHRCCPIGHLTYEPSCSLAGNLAL